MSFYSLEVSSPAPVHTGVVYICTSKDELIEFAKNLAAGTLPFYDLEDQTPGDFFYARSSNILLHVVQHGVVKVTQDVRSLFFVRIQDEACIAFDDAAMEGIEEEEVEGCAVDSEKLLELLPDLEAPLLTEGQIESLQWQDDAMEGTSALVEGILGYHELE